MHNNIPNKFYFISIFERNNIDKLDANTGVIYRNYNKNLDIEEIISVKNYCAKKKIKFLLSKNFKLALKLDLDGAYIPSFNKSFRHLNYIKKSNFIVIGSKQVRQLQYSQSKYQATLPHRTKKDLNKKLNPKQNTIQTLKFILKSLE